MKTGSFVALSLLGLTGLAAAQPRGRHSHGRFHKQLDKKELDKRAIVTETVVYYATSPAEVVYVDQLGRVLYTKTENDNKPPVKAEATPRVELNAAPKEYTFPKWKAVPPAPAPKPPAPTSTMPHQDAAKTEATPAAHVPVKAVAKPVVPPPAVQTPAVQVVQNLVETPVPKPKPAPPAQKPPPTGGYTGSTLAAAPAMGGYGISYSAFNGTCRAASDVLNDFQSLKGFAFVRSYGVNCDQVSSMMAGVRANGQKIMLGVFDIGSFAAELTTLIAAVGGDWSLVQSVTIGNEDVNQGKADVGTVVAATNSARVILRAAGFNGPVAHVDTFNQILANPALCENSDFVAANCHAFFDPNTAAPNAGSFVAGQISNLEAACGGKDVFITETGWPTAGSANGLAVPGPEQQQQALDSIKAKVGGKLTFFSAYDDKWKKDNAATFGAEQHWGMFDTGSTLIGF